MAKVTYDHEEIKTWALRFGGNPQIIDHPEARGDKAGIRINFPGPVDESYLSAGTTPRDMSWEEFFKMFDEDGLALEYEEEMPEFDQNSSYKFLKR